MIRFEPHADGTVLPVRAHAGSKHNEIRAPQDGALRVCITQSPEKGKANKAILDLLSKRLSLRKSQIELIAGETSRQKRFLIRDTTLPELAAKIQAVLDATAK